ncbi:MAG: ABC transporter permease, partial [Gemmatimonadaceae bacterium]
MMLVDTLVRDVRHGWRALRRDWKAALLVVVIAGLGIGASTTVFSICRALVLRPLPFREPDRLVWIANGTSDNLSAQTVQVNNLLELRTSRSFAGIAGFYAFYAPGDIRLTGGGEPERITGVPVTQAFFGLLGVTPLAGRFFDSTETRWNAPKTVVLGHEFWRRRYDGDRGIVGRSIVIDDEPATVIGVLPASFDFAAIFTPGRRADVFLPYPLSPETNRTGNTLALIGRLRDGAALEEAQAEASLIGARVVRGREGDAFRNGLAPRLLPLRERVSGRLRSALIVLASSVAFLMLLVCANVSNLLLIRASARQREMAVRAALGAPRHHLIRQLLAECIILGGGGAALGAALAVAGTAVISRIQGTAVPLLNRVEVDGAVLAFTILFALLTAVVFGLLPSLHASSNFLPAALAEGSRGTTEGRGSRLRRTIVAFEVALVCVLLTGAGLLARSLERVLDVDPGFATEDLVTIRVDPQRSFSAAQRITYFDEVVREVRSIRGVDQVGLTDALPLGDNFGWRRWNARLPGEPRAVGAEGPTPLVRMIDEGYLRTMRITLREGRLFATTDDTASERVMIVNERLARALWPGRSAIGQLLRTSGRDRRVVGVVGDVRYFGLDREADMEMYMPLRTGDYQSVDLVVRSTLPAAALAPAIRAALRRVDRDLPAARFLTMSELVDRSVFTRRFVVLLIAGFASFGLLLAALGIYGVIAYAVTMRQQEIGIRMALGATPGRVRASVLGQTGALFAIGVMVGLPASWLAARTIKGLLFEVGSSDPWTFTAALLLLGAVAALAGYLPARRATRVDPA